MLNTRAWWILAAVVVLAACGPRGERPGGTMEVPELGISLQAPPGWIVQSSDRAMATKGDSTGVIIEDLLHGRAFEELVDELTTEFGATPESRRSRTINGHEAIEVVLAYPNAGTKALKSYIHQPPNLLEVSFVMPAEDFEAEEAHLWAAVDTIELR